MNISGTVTTINSVVQPEEEEQEWKCGRTIVGEGVVGKITSSAVSETGMQTHFLSKPMNPLFNKLNMVKKYYAELPETLKNFVNLYYDQLDYNQFCIDFTASWTSMFPGTDGRHALWIEHIVRFLCTKINWPGHEKSMYVQDLPLVERVKLVDYLGFEIGVHQGQGNDNLLGIYKLYFQEIDRQAKSRIHISNAANK